MGYNAWQIDCLNRIGFNELHRRALRGQKGTTAGKNVRAPYETMETRRQTNAHRRKGYFLPRSKVHTRMIFRFLLLIDCEHIDE